MTMHKSCLLCDVCIGHLKDNLSCCYVHYLGHLRSATSATGWLAAHRLLLEWLLHAPQAFYILIVIMTFSALLLNVRRAWHEEIVLQCVVHAILKVLLPCFQ